MTRKALGRGLDALIPRPVPGAPAPEVAERKMVPVDQILPNPWQPRRASDPQRLEELARSVQIHGILEPLLVRRKEDRWVLVAGERRLQAAQQIGMKEVPIIIVDVDDKGSLEIALIENLQREDLNPVDEARAYHVLVEEFGRTHDEIAVHVGKDRTTITNLLRLLRLPGEVLGLISAGTLSAGHARSLLSFPSPQSQTRWAREAVQHGWSVREIERRIQRHLRASSKEGAAPRAGEKSAHLRRVEEAIRRRVGTEAKLRVNARGAGKLELRFGDREDLERVLELLGVQVH